MSVENNTPLIPKPLTNADCKSDPNPTGTIIDRLLDTTEAAIAAAFQRRGKRSHSEISETTSNSNTTKDTEEETGNKWQTKEEEET